MADASPLNAELRKNLGVFVTGLGVFLSALGLYILYYLSMTTYQLINDPGQVKLVQLLLEKITGSSEGFSGIMPDGKNFKVDIGEPVRYAIYAFLAINLLGVLASVFGGIMGSGVKFVRMGLEMFGLQQKNEAPVMNSDAK